MTKPSPETIEQVKALGRKKLSNSQIERQVPGVNKNQIAGILHRAGIERKKLKVRKIRKVKLETPKPDPKPFVPKSKPPETVEAAPDVRHYVVKPDDENQRLLPDSGQCKWPIGDNPIRFLCANKPLSGCPYCAVHQRFAGGHR